MTILGAEFYMKTVNIDGKDVRMQIWDTSGQERYRAIAPSFIRKAKGVILTYSIDDRKSFQHVEDWMSQIQAHADKDISIVLVGNKMDLPNRVVEYAEGEKLADNYNVKFFETSAKDGTNIEEAFTLLAKDMRTKLIIDEPVSNTNRLSVKPQSKPSGGCC